VQEKLEKRKKQVNDRHEYRVAEIVATQKRLSAKSIVRQRLNSVSCINRAADFGRVFKKLAQVHPVLFP